MYGKLKGLKGTPNGRAINSVYTMESQLKSAVKEKTRFANTKLI